MDTITHIVLGACAGEAIAGRQLGKKALFIGAFANSIPDLDFITALWMDTDEGLLAHRGFSHSFFFAILTAGLLAFLFQRFQKKHSMGFTSWYVFFIVEMLLHLFIDAFNAYGAGWFEPFSHARIAFNVIFVADPFYSISLIIAFIALLVSDKNNKRRVAWTWFGLGISSIYFMYCLANKFKTESDVKKILKTEQLSSAPYFTTPTPLNNWLWFVVIAKDSGYLVGHYSVFDTEKTTFYYFAKNEWLLDSIRSTSEVKNLTRFSKGFYTVEERQDTLVFNDLRFGQMIGWYDPYEKFVFHYYLNRKNANKLVVQRGRFAKWNAQATRSLVKRIKGN